VLQPLGIKVKPFSGKDLEIQADIEQVASFSAASAARKYHRSLIVEDAGLFVESLDGFPGAFSSYVFKTIGVDGLLTLLQDKKSRRAYFRSAVAYCDPEARPRIFRGEVAGTISHSPSGDNGFGFDPVFVPSGGGRTMGELTVSEKCAISHRGEALRKFAAWFNSREGPSSTRTE
jgi:XTP/dITP diphosphohydrolase